MADIGVRRDGLAAIDELLRLAGEHLLVDIAERDDADVGEPAEALDVIAAATTDTDDRHAELLVRAAPANTRTDPGRVEEEEAGG